MIEACNLVRMYDDFKAVDEVSFKIPKGQIVGLLGHNGAGKTTIMKMITGFLEPSAGSITVDGLDVSENLLEVQSKIGYLPEGTPLYSDMTVVQSLEFVCQLRGIPESEMPEAIRRAISKTALQEKALSKVSTLSKGYKQRLGVAQAIIHKPEILILDEPTSGLDPQQIEEMRKLIQELSGDATIILSTHILQEVEAMCERVIIIRGGKLAKDAMLSELQESHVIKISVGETANKVAGVLKGISGVSGVESLTNGQAPGELRVSLDPKNQDEAAASIAKAVVGQGWNLYRLEREHRDLEAVFKEINRGEK